MALRCLPTETGFACRPQLSSSCFSGRFNTAPVPVVRQHSQGSAPTAACAALQPHRPSAASVSSELAAADAPTVLYESIASYEDPLVCVPEDYELGPGVLSSVDRTSPAAPEDAYRCIGCTRPECQTDAGCLASPWRFTQDGYLREILTARVYDVAVQTPLERADKLSDALGNDLLLKREDLQPVFSFKLRGAFNKMAKLPREALQRGVITSSAGNHAQGVALAAAKLGCVATICMPINTPDIKVANVRRLGGLVELVGESYQEAQAYAQARAVRDGLTFVAPYDDPHTIAGQGTIGDEILRQIADPTKLDAIFVAIGGGGLIAGIAAYVKALHPHIQVFGVEPCGANAMAMSLKQGRRITLSRVDAFADGVAVKHVGAETFRLCRQLCDGVLLVDNAAISAAIKDVFNETRSILEPAGAVAVAGAKAFLKENGHQGKTVVAVTSGANINFERLRLVSELADLGASTEVMMATSIPEQPGAFREFVHTAAGSSDTDLNVTEFKYRFSAGASANILWSAGVRDRSEVTQAIERLQAAGMPTIDISGMDSARIHLRHLVGGRARSYMGEIPNERMYQVTIHNSTFTVAALDLA
eukprot:GHRQ01010082.1.p1 GENE.GHRQ01010082.1~~GHRQ01010082.1.p1  ORF type:complete len:591 (+),score=253.76 GHRQ01010082.1:116-1888(+)